MNELSNKFIAFLVSPLILVKPETRKELFLYLAVSESATSAVLIKKDKEA